MAIMRKALDENFPKLVMAPRRAQTAKTAKTYLVVFDTYSCDLLGSTTLETLPERHGTGTNTAL